jgi:hypothetical protein
VIPAKQHGEFVAKMEDILAVYALPYDENVPLVYMDEQPVQLLKDRYDGIALNVRGKLKSLYPSI